MGRRGGYIAKYVVKCINNEGAPELKVDLMYIMDDSLYGGLCKVDGSNIVYGKFRFSYVGKLGLYSDKKVVI